MGEFEKAIREELDSYGSGYVDKTAIISISEDADTRIAEQQKIINSYREIIAQAHMAGQCDAGIDPSYSNALNYVDKLLGENNG